MRRNIVIKIFTVHYSIWKGQLVIKSTGYVKALFFHLNKNILNIKSTVK